jgi:tol-pal system protein YbgF
MIAPRCQFVSAVNRRWLGPVLAIAIIATAPMLGATPVGAQSSDVQPLVNTINRLERQLQALERRVYRGATPPAGSATVAVADGRPPPAAVSQLQLKSDQLEEQIRGLTGQIEELGFKVNQITSRLDRLVADIDFRLRALEGSGGQTNAVSGAIPGAPAPSVRSPSGPPVAPRRAPKVGGIVVNPEGAPGPSLRFGTLTESQVRAAGIKPTDSGAGAEAGGGSELGQAGSQQATANAGDESGLPPGTPQESYNYARSFLMRRDFAGAEQSLRAFVETYPEDELAGNAQYWLGETFYVRDDFGSAARAFADGFQRYPGSAKAPDNLLKLGMSLAALERTEDACITLKKLAKEYPKAPANIKKRAESERNRLKCK